MKFHLTDDIEIKEIILEGLKLHKGYCPCAINGEGKPEFKCPCKEFRVLPLRFRWEALREWSA